jgi:hypothetical protein
VCCQAAAFLPAARRGIGLGLRRGQAPTLLLFMAQLLQVHPALVSGQLLRSVDSADLRFASFL